MSLLHLDTNYKFRFFSLRCVLWGDLYGIHRAIAEQGIEIYFTYGGNIIQYYAHIHENKNTSSRMISTTTTTWNFIILLSTSVQYAYYLDTAHELLESLGIE